MSTFPLVPVGFGDTLMFDPGRLPSLVVEGVRAFDGVTVEVALEEDEEDEDDEDDDDEEDDEDEDEDEDWIALLDE